MLQLKIMLPADWRLLDTTQPWDERGGEVNAAAVGMVAPRRTDHIPAFDVKCVLTARVGQPDERNHGGCSVAIWTLNETQDSTCRRRVRAPLCAYKPVSDLVLV